MAFLLTLTACGLLRGFAVRRALVDMPNERSLHSIPVPRLGGAAIAIGVWVVTILAGLFSRAFPADVVAWLVASVLIAAVGLADDLRPIQTWLRLTVQFAIAAVLVIAIGAPAHVVLADGWVLSLPTWTTSAMWIVGIVGVLNIYNFMDGMDGLAGAQAIGAGIGVASAAFVHGDHDLAFIAAIVAASSAGFFIYNVGPAKIFMGDAGSTMIGFTFAALALVAHRRTDPLPVPVVLLALAPFLLDGGFTLVRRALRGEPVWRAHRTHLYQRAVTAGLSHRQVLTPYAGWVAAAAIAAALGARADGRLMLALAGAMALGLAVTWTWVAHLEKRQSQNA